jgi:hypothetical protein
MALEAWGIELFIWQGDPEFLPPFRPGSQLAVGMLWLLAYLEPPGSLRPASLIGRHKALNPSLNPAPG